MTNIGNVLCDCWKSNSENPVKMKLGEMVKRECEVFRSELLFRNCTFRICIQINFSYCFKRKIILIALQAWKHVLTKINLNKRIEYCNFHMFVHNFITFLTHNFIILIMWRLIKLNKLKLRFINEKHPIPHT